MCENFEESLSDVWTFILGSLPDTEPVDVQGKFGSSLDLESVVLIEDGLLCLSEQCFRIVSIAEDGGSGISAKLGVDMHAHLFIDQCCLNAFIRMLNFCG